MEQVLRMRLRGFLLRTGKRARVSWVGKRELRFMILSTYAASTSDKVAYEGLNGAPPTLLMSRVSFPGRLVQVLTIDSISTSISKTSAITVSICTFGYCFCNVDFKVSSFC